MRIFKPSGSQFYWFELRWRGKHIRRSTKMINHDEALDFAVNFRTKLRFGEIGVEEKPVIEPKTIGELLDGIKADFESRGIASGKNLSLLNLTKESFGKLAADKLTTEEMHREIKKLREAGLADNTINNRLLLIKNAFNYAKQNNLWNGPEPSIPNLRQDNPREGFFEREDMDRLAEFLPPVYRDFCLLSFLIGWRRGAISGLQWSDVRDGRLYLRGVLSKNREPYFVPLQGELTEIIERRRQARKVELSDGSTVLSSYIFHEHGKPIGEFTSVWQRACVSAGFGCLVCPKCKTEDYKRSKGTCPQCKTPMTYKGKLFHDFRRSAVRSLVLSGSDRKTAMRITGHKTEAIFERYHIVKDNDLKTVLDNVFRYNEAQRKQITPISRKTGEK